MKHCWQFAYAVAAFLADLATVRSRKPFLKRRATEDRWRMRPVPCTFLRLALMLQLSADEHTHAGTRARGKTHHNDTVNAPGSSGVHNTQRPIADKNKRCLKNYSRKSPDNRYNSMWGECSSNHAHEQPCVEN